VEFTKIHGTGNDFVLINDLNNSFVGKEKDLSEKICHRRFGVGADGVIFVRNSSIADTQMVIYNSDGSYAEMCGNGIRCFAKYVYDNKIVLKDEITIETGDGIKIAYLDIENKKVNSVKIDMGTYTFEPSKIPVKGNDEIIDLELKENGKVYKVTTLLLGVPHTIIFGELDSIDVNEGKAVEFNDLYPVRTNVNFCEVVDRSFVKVKTWERGAGPTMACGTGSCAAVVVANMFGKTDNIVKVSVPGGEMTIELTEDKRVFMTGPAITVFEGAM
jgi:diaminopimelate epimerase